jgi:formylmethanofuran dehydrogenase subunit C
MKILKNCKGSSLVLVMIVFLFLITISAALLTATYASFNSANQQQISQQAYFTARSAVNATIEYIQNNAGDANAGDANAMNDITTNIGTGSVPSMGTYKVLVNYVDTNNNVVVSTTNKMKIVATANYNGQTYKVAAYLSKLATAAINPTDKLFYVTGSASSGIGQCSMTGDLYINGDFNLSQGSSINGSVVCTGNASITGAGATTNGLVSFGNVSLDNSGAVNGDVICEQDFIMQGDARVYGNVYVNGNFKTGSKGSANVTKNVLCVKNASFDGNNTVTGDFYAGGTITPSNTSLIKGTAIQNTSVTPADLSRYTASTLPTISVPTVTQNAQLYTPVTLMNNKISNSGTLAKNGTINLNTNVTIDASIADISLLISNSTYNINNGGFKVIGSHNVTIYMMGNSSLNLKANSFVGMEPSSATLALFIIGDAAQTVTLTNNSELDAYVYIPNGNFSATGDNLTTYKFKGSMTAKSIIVDNGVNLLYIKLQNLTSSPLAPLASSGSGSGGSWNIESWSNS